jgi:hypothetical protein
MHPSYRKEPGVVGHLGVALEKNGKVKQVNMLGFGVIYGGVAQLVRAAES